MIIHVPKYFSTDCHWSLECREVGCSAEWTCVVVSRACCRGIGRHVVLHVANGVDVKPSVEKRFESLVHFVYVYVVEIVHNARCLPMYLQLRGVDFFQALLTH
jgi:hypothetical protein